ncbi:MAG: hypothetical protein HQK53_17020 [Oligoflexia bacterium]|nr:hypothetical protein [Oligoflexia bacterium]
MVLKSMGKILLVVCLFNILFSARALTSCELWCWDGDPVMEWPEVVRSRFLSDKLKEGLLGQIRAARSKVFYRGQKLTSLEQKKFYAPRVKALTPEYDDAYAKDRMYLGMCNSLTRNIRSNVDAVHTYRGQLEKLNQKIEALQGVYKDQQKAIVVLGEIDAHLKSRNSEHESIREIVGDINEWKRSNPQYENDPAVAELLLTLSALEDHTGSADLLHWVKDLISIKSIDSVSELIRGLVDDKNQINELITRTEGLINSDSSECKKYEHMYQEESKRRMVLHALVNMKDIYDIDLLRIAEGPEFPGGFNVYYKQ